MTPIRENIEAIRESNLTTPKRENIEAIRESYRAREIPPSYSGIRHLAATAAVTIGGIALSFFFVKNVTLRQLLIVPVTFLYAVLAEYVGHRGPMHRRFAALADIYKHTTIHHVFFTHEAFDWSETKDFHALLLPWYILLFFFGAFIGPAAVALRFALSANAAALFVATALFYFLNYELLHFAYHSPESSLAARLPLIKTLRRHHLLHHNPKFMSRYNFNITYPLFDWMFGTTYRPGKPSRRRPAFQKTPMI